MFGPAPHMRYVSYMADVALTLPDPLMQFIDSQVGPDGYPDRQAVIKAAVANMREGVSDFHAAIQEGLDAMERGEVERVDDLEAWFADIRRSWRA